MQLGLWLACLATVVFLSLWPFTFDLSRGDEVSWLVLARSWGWATSRGDMLGNVALFVPVGFLGALALKSLAGPARIVIVFVTAFLVATLVQIGQVLLPHRSATMVDVLWNMVGLVPGLVLGSLATGMTIERHELSQRLRLLPWAILAIWLSYRLIPFLPSIDWQLIKDNLKPLLFQPTFKVTSIVTGAAAWLAAGYLMRAGDSKARLDRLLPLLIAGVLGAEVVIAYRDGLSANNVVGALAGLALWFGLARHLRRPALFVTAALAAAVAVNGLWPFTFDWIAPRSFNWVPFEGILGGSMALNVLALTEKVYFYAAGSFALRELVGSWGRAAILAGGFVFTVEALQIFQTGHVPEVTDPVLVLLACFAGAALSPRTGRVRHAS